MNGNEFLKWLRKEARRRGLPAPVVETNRGRGSHVTVFIGERFTVLKDRK